MGRGLMVGLGEILRVDNQRDIWGVEGRLR